MLDMATGGKDFNGIDLVMDGSTFASAGLTGFMRGATNLSKYTRRTLRLGKQGLVGSRMRRVS